MSGRTITPKRVLCERSDEDEEDAAQHRDMVVTAGRSDPPRGLKHETTNNPKQIATNVNYTISSTIPQTITQSNNRNRGRTRRHYLRKRASMLASTPWESGNTLPLEATMKAKRERKSASARALPWMATGARAASVPPVSISKHENKAAEHTESALTRMWSWQQKPPHEVHRETVQDLNSNDERPVRVFGQFSFGVVRLISEEKRLQDEDGPTLSGGVLKKQSLSKRSSLEDHYEKGSLEELERMRSNISRCERHSSK
eukprot:TRINITY_DN8113_c0_g1_i1.p1 TRINITY_DN8113_c0_g1~~TRINITY_DN8113_c0_g1_i1.p1  ORF type:complete len:258 (-),score=35.60 TRINITY_DN8113_c0_g1_i1:141-914(-)